MPMAQSPRYVFGGKEDAGAPAKARLGDISAPAQYLCGAGDTVLHCTRPYALRTREHCTGGYTYTLVHAGHDMLPNERVHDALIAHIEAHT